MHKIHAIRQARHGMPRIVAGLGVIGIALLFILNHFFIVNETPSLPMGLYWKEHRDPGKGDLAAFCPRDDEWTKEARIRGYIGAGLCPGNTGYLIKRVSGMEGDRIIFEEQGVFVNGVLVENSRPQKQDGQGRRMRWQKGERILGAGEFLLLSGHHPGSYDSRYFGVMGREHIRAVLRPFWIWQ